MVQAIREYDSPSVTCSMAYHMPLPPLSIHFLLVPSFSPSVHVPSLPLRFPCRPSFSAACAGTVLLLPFLLFVSRAEERQLALWSTRCLSLAASSSSLFSPDYPVFLLPFLSSCVHVRTHSCSILCSPGSRFLCFGVSLSSLFCAIDPSSPNPPVDETRLACSQTGSPFPFPLCATSRSERALRREKRKPLAL